MTDPVILAVDIGGTNTRAALLDGTRLRADTIKRYPNADNDGIESILRRYVAECPAQLSAVSLALAGPVEGTAGRLTNLDWAFTAASAAEAAGAPQGFLLNDLQAQGHALPFLDANALTHVLDAPAGRTGAPALVINVGTGLNIAVVHTLADRTLVPAAEAGHVTLAPHGAALRALQEDLTQQLGHASAEDVLSGRGLERCYTHVTDARMPAAGVMQMVASGDAEARKALGLMIEALGQYAGDMALTHLPVGGIYLVGGVARAVTPYLADLGFADSFRNKGRFSDFMARFSVYAVNDDYAALVGAASFALERLQD